MMIARSVYRGLVMLRHPEAVGLRRRGVDFDQYRALRQPWLLDLGIRTILDIGANTGQFARLANAVFPSATIHSFEPLPDCFRLLERALPGVDRFHGHNLAIGDQDGDLEIHPCTHRPSSSFLVMTPLHEEAFPYAVRGQHERPIRVRVRALDRVTEDLSPLDRLLIKMDVQGYEDKVIAGGKDTLRRAAVLLIETSFAPLYEGQPLFDEVYHLVVDLGFSYRGSLQKMVHPLDGRAIAEDSLFVRRDLADRPPASSP